MNLGGVDKTRLHIETRFCDILQGKIFAEMTIGNEYKYKVVQSAASHMKTAHTNKPLEHAGL